MTDFFNWSIDLGRWRGTRVRVHYGLVLSAALALLGPALTDLGGLVPAIVKLAMLALILVLHELGHVAAARLRDAEVEDVLFWHLGNLVGPSRARSNEDAASAAGGLMVSGGLALIAAIGLAISGARMVFLPFGGEVDSGSPYVYSLGGIINPLSIRWYVGWFGWLNLVVFSANLIPALPFDMGRVLRARLSRVSIGLVRDAMIGPWFAHTSTALLVVVGSLRLLFYGRADGLTLLALALLIEIFVRVESRMMEEGSFFDEGAFGYDFSEGYTSLESGAAKVRPQRESTLKRWRRRRSEQRRLRRQAQSAADERRLDEILDKLHNRGKSALTDEENRFLVRVSAAIRKKPKDRE